MPLPTPKKDESKDDFVNRCMGNDTMKSDFPDNDQRLAVCFKQWKEKKSTGDYEMRALPVEFRIDQAEGREIITGHAAVFNTWMDNSFWGFREKIMPGAFKKSIQEHDTVALFNHDPNFPLGRLSAGNLKLEEDQTGLRMELEPTKTGFANDLKENIRAGVVKGQSIGFRVIGENWNYPKDEPAERTISEIELWDVSPVVFPAYPETDVSVALRSLELHKTPGDAITAGRAEADKPMLDLLKAKCNFQECFIKIREKGVREDG